MNIAIISINSFIIFSFLFFMLKHFLIDKKLNEPSSEWSWFTIYIVLSGLLIALQNYFFSSTDDCIPQPTIILIHTIIPLIFIMGTTMIFLVQMNWNRIFANTFGLWLAPKLTLTGHNLTSTGQGDNPSGYSLFYNDPNILLQELETDDLFQLDKLNPKLKELGINNININEDQHTIIKEQYYTKQNVGYFIWLTFTGIVSSLVSANSILLQDCVIE